MNIVIIHCHFERGGVTQVVENHVRGLSDDDSIKRISLVSGNRTSGLGEATRSVSSQIVIDGFDYDSVINPEGAASDRAKGLANELCQSLESCGFDRQETVIHWHNHSLGKNNAAPDMIRKLASDGWHLLLQVHDFAEDNRPSNYAGIIQASESKTKADVDRFLYPVASQIHYAALTRGDTDIFCSMGMTPDRTHCLPNPVVFSGEAIDHDSALNVVRDAMGLPTDSRWVLYPVRGIRRKNVGEFALVSRLLPKDMFAGITLAPATPIERRSYERWRELAKSVAPRAVFDAGMNDGVSFAQNLAATQYVLSTSVAEGFGMVFLEPWLAHRAVIARDLPTVTGDFKENGIQFPMLYPSIAIPGATDWLDACRRETADAESVAWSEVAPEFRPKTASVGVQEAAIDFAKLTPKRQAEVLQRVASDAGFESDVVQHSHALIDQLEQSPSHDLVCQNRQRVREFYSPGNQTRHLLDVYQRVLDSGIENVVGGPAGERPAVDCISEVRPYYPCRTEELI